MRFALLAAVLLGACSRGSLPSSSNAATSASGPTTQATPGTLALGERITASWVPLAQIAKDPSAFQGRVIATSGKVTAVCQEMGCWMQLEDASGQAHVRMHGHTFFVPKTAPGHLARVQATIVESAGGANDCENAKAAKVELDATGIELD